MNCISLDGDPRALAALRQMIEQVDYLELKRTFTDAVEAFSYLEQHEVDLFFLDVEMPLVNGLELIDTLEQPPLIIIVTARKEYAIEAFEKHVVDFLVKPVSLTRFLSSINFARRIFESRQLKKQVTDILFVKADGRWNKLNLADVKYLQAMGDYVRIYTEKGTYMVNKTMKTIMQNLPEEKFVRVHRSYIINIRHIENIEENSILIGRDVIPVSEHYKAAFMQHLNLL